MANQLFRDGNYIIIIDDTGKTTEYAINKTVYSQDDENQRIIIAETGVDRLASGRRIITYSDIAGGNWADEGEENEIFLPEIIAFLRANTGFNPASGGSEAAGPKIFEAILKHQGAASPVSMEILQNDFPIVPVFSNFDTGAYLITAAGQFPLDKTTVQITVPNFADTAVIPGGYRSDNDNVLLTTHLGDASLTSGIMGLATSLIIKVYE